MKKKVKEILGTSLYLLGVLVFTFLIVTYVGQRTKVSGGSMEPMLSDGDNLIMDKISYRFQDPQRFDIVVFPFQYANRPYYIKRIIGLPGETIYIDDDGNIYINNEILNEPYGKEVIADPGRAYEPITLGEDEYFVMGDNRILQLNRKIMYFILHKVHTVLWYIASIINCRCHFTTISIAACPAVNNPFFPVVLV